MADNDAEVPQPGPREQFVLPTVAELYDSVVVRVLVCIVIAYLLLRAIGRLIRLVYPVISPPFINYMSKTYNARMGQIKHLLFADLGELQSQNKGKLTILEVGAGGGANFEFYPRGTKVVAVDPNERYKKYLVNSVKQFRHVRLDQFIAAEGEDMSAIADNSFDVVVSTLVMCSVKEPKAYVDEIKRVLKPGGKFYYMEHVCATKNSWTHLMQRMLNPVFKFCTDGCQLTKQTWKYIDEAGFSKLEYSLMFAPLRRTTQVIRPHMIGHAIK